MAISPAIGRLSLEIVLFAGECPSSGVITRESTQWPFSGWSARSVGSSSSSRCQRVLPCVTRRVHCVQRDARGTVLPIFSRRCADAREQRCDSQRLFLLMVCSDECMGDRHGSLQGLVRAVLLYTAYGRLMYPRLQRRDFKRYMRTGGSTPVQKVLMLLVDLGVIYTAFMVRFHTVVMTK